MSGQGTFTKKMTFEQNYDGSERGNYVDIIGKIILSCESRKYRGLVFKVRLIRLRKSKEARVVEILRGRQES